MLLTLTYTRPLIVKTQANPDLDPCGTQRLTTDETYSFAIMANNGLLRF